MLKATQINQVPRNSSTPSPINPWSILILGIVYPSHEIFSLPQPACPCPYPPVKLLSRHLDQVCRRFYPQPQVLTFRTTVLFIIASCKLKRSNSRHSKAIGTLRWQCRRALEPRLCSLTLPFGLTGLRSLSSGSSWRRRFRTMKQ